MGTEKGLRVRLFFLSWAVWAAADRSGLQIEYHTDRGNIPSDPTAFSTTSRNLEKILARNNGFFFGFAVFLTDEALEG
jgi:hypothetical protein